MELWSAIMGSMQPPPADKTVWQDPSPSNLSIVLIEGRADHCWLSASLKNIAHLYGGSDASLFLFGSRDSVAAMRELTKEWTNVHYEVLAETMTIDTYNEVLTSASLWERFTSARVLITQTDVILRKRVPEALLAYNYIGAPWKSLQTYCGTQWVGNGGLSLRNPRRMAELCRAYRAAPGMHKNEDLFFAWVLEDADVAPFSVAASFSVESVFHDDPVGLHQAYTYFTNLELEEVLRNIPGAAKQPGYARQALQLKMRQRMTAAP